VNEYSLYLKKSGTWAPICRVEAATHADALRVAGACLRPEHDELPIRFQQEPRDDRRGPAVLPRGAGCGVEG
jgi:hypothetical protein